MITIIQARVASLISFLVLLIDFLPASQGFSIWTAKIVKNELKPNHPRFIQLAAEKQEGDDPDLFEYFDPLLSPHAYPNGIQAGEKPADDVSLENEDDDDDRYDPLRFRQTFSSSTRFSGKKRSDPFGITIPPPLKETEEDRPAVDTATTFDPTISPHEYAKGVPDIIVGDEGADYILEEDEQKTNVVGVLFMDHGSRNDASNKRLHDLAKLYQQSVPSSKTTTVIVRAAHMEIATPSVKDGIVSLIEAGVDEIVCHPYFLSPGRHVKEDIPRIVTEAIEALNVEIPVRTTEPVGSVTDIMLKAVHSLVEETSELYGKKK